MLNERFMKKIIAAISLLILGGCMGMPAAVKPVENFDLDQYLGKWYEIARLDHSFERGMEQVTAEYALKKGGGVTVVNRGYLSGKDKWKTAEGKAYFVDKSNEGYLKVSFFGPFYASYVVFELDHENYQYAFVSGPDNEFLWFLSRTPNVDQDIRDKFLGMSGERGFNTENLVWVKQK
jgi:apolipoprotein D and lipocalin family protein